MELEFKVNGMQCESCVDKIEKFIGEIDGVEFIEVKLREGKVKVVGDASLSREQIKEAILDSGFEVVE
ncbi:MULTISPECIES: heavy-metal-associated domain-containing protein [unclassified Helicobacter]|uniref:heavy-metal-associated domain-containing protein n=1 Tax=unclassified Helicobacter TaxID=2593540 RepID=UPI000CF18660|nr:MULTISPECIES: heavy metal-associated domain-containing protein [unclassified Helicobacter]